MEIKIDFDKKKIRIVGNIESKHFSILNDFLTRLYEEDEDFMIVNEVEASNILKDFPTQRAHPISTTPYRNWIEDNPLELRAKRQDPGVPWKSIYNSIDQSLFKVTCTACADTCTHQILNPNPNDKA
jgi:hypothetical protein